MKHGIAFRKLGRTSSHRDLMLRNLVSSLLEHGQIKTTVAKAKETARLAEKVITLGKRGDLWAKTTAQAMLFKHDITLPLLFNEYANRYANRPGGYTRMHFYGNRVGDNAPHAIIELVDGPNDIRFAMTARAVGRETAEAVLQGRATSSEPVEGEAGSSSVTDGGVLLRPTTQKNLEKTLKYRSEEDKQRFRTMAAEWAVGVIHPCMHPKTYSFIWFSSALL
ncbi:ribosomal protein L17 [Clavulina sp. PMI_390]|nr:ribosomal protein L17 [Clavulina sp. PMI_390]